LASNKAKAAPVSGVMKMPIIEWNMGFMLGIPEIDRHHKHLVKLLNEAYDEFRDGVAVEQSVIDELTVYASQVFAFEENLMRETSYPKLSDHKDEHETFCSRVNELRDTFKKNKNVSIELLWFLCNWVTHHLRETDAEFGRFVDMYNIQKRVGGESR
jgi:hemerythrin